MIGLLRSIPARIDDVGFSALATVLTVIYGAIALEGSHHEIVQVILSALFIPALLFWRRAPISSATALLLLISLWTWNWITALPINLGFSPFILVVPIVVYSTTRWVKQRIISALFYVTTLIYCFVSPIMWYQTETGMIYHNNQQGLSWLLIQWLGLTVLRQIAINRRREEARGEERRRSQEHAAMEEQAAIRERERVQIAREIHDVLAHSLTLINIQASAGIMVSRHGPTGTDAEIDEILQRIQETSSSSLSEVRAIVKALRSDLPTESAHKITSLVSTVENLEQYQQAGMAITTSLSSPTVLEDLSASTPFIVQLAISRILNESLTNVARHQGVDSKVNISISVDDMTKKINIDIESWAPHGVNIAHTPPLMGTKSGLTGMKERVESLMGTITYSSQPGYFRVQATVPTRSFPQEHSLHDVLAP